MPSKKRQKLGGKLLQLHVFRNGGLLMTPTEQLKNVKDFVNHWNIDCKEDDINILLVIGAMIICMKVDSEES